ncbi:MAG: TrkH family potassium uptake protein [Clostridiales bacterium]|nr:TrkH family potassium uptake protein [Clostridiales bacterium]
MNRKKISSYLGNILLIEALLLGIPAGLSIYFREKAFLSFAFTIALLAVAGILCIKIKPETGAIHAREGYVIVGLAWILMSAFGALPFFISGCIPNYINALFETVSGFTTTGSTILDDIEVLPKSILFWRSFTHFIGGMGILVFALAVMPKSDDGGDMHIMRAEVPGPTVGKLVSKIRATATILYGIYCGMTLVLVILLIIGGMPVFDSFCNAFATAGTGGFGLLNSSIAGYNSYYCEMVIAVFMILFGTNFNLYYLIIRKKIGLALKNEELHWYLGFIAFATAVITINLFSTEHWLDDSFRYAFFQVASIISTTGFSTADFDKWPQISKTTLFILMFIGGMGGSTGGGLKVNRVIIAIKSGIRSIKNAINPKLVQSVKVDDEPVDENLVKSVALYVSNLFAILFVSVFIISLDGYDFTETISSVVACASNVGPGFGWCGPSGNFSSFSALSKIVLILDMLIGRLEIIPILILFARGFRLRKYN